MTTENEIYDTCNGLTGLADMLRMTYEYVQFGDDVDFLVINNNYMHADTCCNFTSDVVKELNELLTRDGLFLMMFENKSILTDLESFALNKDSVTAFVDNI